MTPERRIHARRILYSPEYLDMGADNGGMVVNLSEGGLGFQSVSPVIPLTEIPISFSLGTGYRIDVKVRVAWVSDEGKVGGAVFGKLSKDSQSLIREWVAKANADHETDHEDRVLYAVPEAEGHATHEAAPSIAARAVGIVDQEANESREPITKASVLGIEEVAAQNGVMLPSYGSKSSEVTAELPLAHEASQPTPETAAAPTAPSLQDSSKIAPTRPATQDVIAAAPRNDGSAADLLQRRTISGERAPEQKPEHQPTSRFSAVPSISAWSRKSAPESIKRQNVQSNASPLSPLRNTENIFARSPSPDEPVHEKSGSAKLFVIALIIAAAALGAFYVRTHRRQIGTAIAQIGAKVAGSPAVSSGPPASAAAIPLAKSQNSSVASPAPVKGTPPDSQGDAANTKAAIPARTAAQSAARQATNTTASSALVPAADKSATPVSSAPNKAKTVVQTPLVTGSNQATHGASKGANLAPASAASLLAGQSDYQRAEQYLNGQGVTQDYSEAAQWFWRSLEAGYTNAALPLANLYLDGSGVSRSCTQARILLDAAAQKNNAQAIQRLAQLPENCQ